MRKLDLKTLDDVVAEMRRLHRDGYVQEGEWDLGQAVRHLDAAMVGSVDGFKFKLPWLLQKMIILFYRGRIFRKRSMKRGIPTDRVLIPPAEGDPAEAIDQYEADTRRLLAHEDQFHPHPVLGNLSRDRHIEFHVIHAMHHLRMLRPKDESQASS
jgi:hypothetical protein